MSKKIDVKQEAWDFFLYSYFGIFSEGEHDDEKKFKCAQRAYLDLNRTLKFNEGLKKDSSRNKAIKDEFVKRLSAFIVKELESFPEKTELAEIIKKTHDAMMKMKFVYDEGNENVLLGGETYFGQAQKWVNMTIKYMWLIGLWDDDMPMDVPVDSYIMEAAAGRTYGDERDHDGENISLPCKGGKKNEPYSEGRKNSPKVWSKWDKPEYKEFQEELKKELEKKGEKSIFEWENREWIHIAKLRTSRTICKIDEVDKKFYEINVKTKE